MEAATKMRTAINLSSPVGGPGALHGEGLPSAASEFVRSANSYLRVICKASNGGYATSRGANIALGITRNNFIRALNALHSSMATGGKFLAASVFVSISGAFTEGVMAYGW